MWHAAVSKKCIQNFGRKAWTEATAKEDLGTEGRVVPDFILNKMGLRLRIGLL